MNTDTNPGPLTDAERTGVPGKVQWNTTAAQAASEARTAELGDRRQAAYFQLD